MDKEKIITAMEWCRENPCKGCPYEQNKDADGVCTINDDTIILLKEQKPVEPVSKIEQNEWTVCGVCGQHLIHKWSYCPYCGRAVKWE